MKLSEPKPIVKTFTGVYRDQNWQVASAVVPAIHLEEYTIAPGEEIPGPAPTEGTPETMSRR
jgi:hypothetical protein